MGGFKRNATILAFILFVVMLGYGIIIPIMPFYADTARPMTFNSYSLAEMRDTLLPRLISGELRIQDAESFLETTT